VWLVGVVSVGQASAWTERPSETCRGSSQNKMNFILCCVLLVLIYRDENGLKLEHYNLISERARVSLSLHSHTDLSVLLWSSNEVTTKLRKLMEVAE